MNKVCRPMQTLGWKTHNKGQASSLTGSSSPQGWSDPYLGGGHAIDVDDEAHAARRRLPRGVVEALGRGVVPRLPHLAHHAHGAAPATGRKHSLG